MATNEIRIEFHTHATSYGTGHGTGPYHPAIATGHSIMYWPNVTFTTEDEAYDFAARAMKSAYDAAAAVAREWNIYSV